MHKRKAGAEFYRFFRTVLGFTPRNEHLYQVAFLHKSMSEHTTDGRRINNERLEYLGDALLSAMVAEMLFKRYPGKGEGYLTELRSKIVSRQSLNALAHNIGLTQLVNYDRHQKGTFKSVDGDAFEALVGAIYLERGYNFTRKVVINRIIARNIDIDSLAGTDWNFKSKLIDWGQRNRRKVSFNVIRTYVSKPGNRTMYECCAMIDGEPHASASDFTIKGAEQLAAEKTYHQLSQLTEN
ncbi:MAG: ribonuclease III [Bacteroidales bacterium]|nr:ribonuclease III [Bacteroidales bacterium]